MNRTLAAILCFLYLAASLDTGMTLHYCCGKLTQVALSFGTGMAEQNPSCPMRTNYRGKDCCRDVHTPTAVSHDQRGESPIVLTAAAFAGILVPPSLTLAPSRLSTAASFSIHSPPLLPGPPVYLKNCSFLI